MYKLLLLTSVVAIGQAQSAIVPPVGDPWLLAANETSCTAGLNVDDRGDTMVFISYSTIGDTLSMGISNDQWRFEELASYDVTLTLPGKDYKVSSLGYEESPSRSGLVTTMSADFFNTVKNSERLKVKLESEKRATKHINLEDSHGAASWLQNCRAHLQKGKTISKRFQLS